MTRTRHTAITAVAVVLGLGGVAGLGGCSIEEPGEPVAASGYATAQTNFRPSPDNPDPTDDIEGVTKEYYPAAYHVLPTARVRYEFSPPFGGRHDGVWASCTGVVYPEAIRTENAVHSLEHGAVWITYNPDEVDTDAVALLAERVDGVDYTLMSPYPGLDHAVSVQSWGHQLKVDRADDPRIDQFIAATRQNVETGVYSEDPDASGFPEPGATCATIPGAFDPLDPPPFDPRPGDLPDR
jgi:hypothetical protein